MSDNTTISWTDATWNVVTGCTRVSEGCDHCYIERTMPFRKDGRRFSGEGIGATTGVRLHLDRLDIPLHWRKPRRVFVCSLADLFHDQVHDALIAQVWNTMAQCPQHVFQILTKRPARMRAWVNINVQELGNPVLSNVWLGVSVENQQWADKRIPILLDTPAAVRWVSAEPLLGPVNLGSPLKQWAGGSAIQINRHLHWIVVGGESGPNARPMSPYWVQSLQYQCQSAGVAFHFKQAGWVLARAWGCRDPKGHDPAEWPVQFPREYPDGP